MSEEPQDGDAPEGGPPVATRGFELGVGVLLMALATVVMVDSLRVGAGWADDGPKAGYFPFYIGLALLVSSGWVVLAQLRDWARVKPFARRSELRSMGAMLGPMLVHGALIKPLGIYVASVLLIGWFMLRHGRHHLATTLATAVGVPLFFFVLFERWFVVPLPKGPLEALLGL